jgi:hypothetical protein
VPRQRAGLVRGEGSEKRVFDERARLIADLTNDLTGAVCGLADDWEVEDAADCALGNDAASRRERSLEEVPRDVVDESLQRLPRRESRRAEQQAAHDAAHQASYGTDSRLQGAAELLHELRWLSMNVSVLSTM